MINRHTRILVQFGNNLIALTTGKITLAIARAITLPVARAIIPKLDSNSCDTYTNCNKFIINVCYNYICPCIYAIVVFCRVLYVDLEDEESVSLTAQEAQEVFGRIDILVNNAG